MGLKLIRGYWEEERGDEGRGGEGVKKDDHSREEEAKRKKHHVLFAHHWRIEWLIH